MAKKRLKTLTQERAKELVGFDKTLKRIQLFQPEIKVTEQLSWYDTPRSEKEKAPTGLVIYLDRKNREVLSQWLNENSTHGNGYRSPAIVMIQTFHQSCPHIKEDDFAEILVKGFVKWANIEAEFIKEGIPYEEWYEN